MTYKTKGFTLIELVIVIAIIGIIAAAVLTSINPFENQKVSRDTVRVSSLTSISQSLELYFSENKSYPTSLNADNLELTLGKYNSRLKFTDPSGCNFGYQYNSTDNTYLLYSISEATKFNVPKGQGIVEVVESLPLGVSDISCNGLDHSGNYLIVKSN